MYLIGNQIVDFTTPTTEAKVLSPPRHASGPRQTNGLEPPLTMKTISQRSYRKVGLPKEENPR